MRLGQLARITGKSVRAGMSMPGTRNHEYVGRLSRMKAVGPGVKALAHSGKYAGQFIRGAASPEMLAGMAISYVPMMMMSQNYDQPEIPQTINQLDPASQMNYETASAMVPLSPTQQTYSMTNMLQPSEEDLLRQQMLDSQMLYG